jgi:hypothetical protein
MTIILNRFVSHLPLPNIRPDSNSSVHQFSLNQHVTTTAPVKTNHLFDITNGPCLERGKPESFVISSDHGSESKNEQIGQGILLTTICLWFRYPEQMTKLYRQEKIR